MRKVNFNEAIGFPLAHDIVSISPLKKGRAFKRGYIIKEEDQADFAQLGKQTFYILEDSDEDRVHEEDAALVLYNKLSNEMFSASEVVLGKINLIANTNGIFKIDKEKLLSLNMLGEISVACLENNKYVEKGDIVASMRIIPLFTSKTKIEQINNLDLQLTFAIKEIEISKIGLITTGSEIYNNLITDAFKPVLDQKFNKFNLEITKQDFVPDDYEIMETKLKTYLDSDYDLIILTGGMSVDPDDLTPTVIKNSGVEIISYGSPIIPGSMFLIGYYQDKVILGLPGAVIHEDKTAFDVIINRVLIKEKYTLEDINKLAVGGLLIG